jgi:hypothetical protein
MRGSDLAADLNVIPVKSPRKFIRNAGESFRIKLIERRNDFRFVYRNSRLIEVGKDLVNDMSRSWPFQIERDKSLRIGIGLCLSHPHALGRPNPEQPSAPTLRLEAQFLIQLVFRLVASSDFTKNVLHAPPRRQNYQ